MSSNHHRAGLQLVRAATGLALALALGSVAIAAGTGSGSSDADSASLSSAQSKIDGGDYAGALVDLAAAKTADPSNPDVHNLIGYAHRKLGHLGDAADAYETALSLDGEHRGALEYQGELFLMLDQLDDAKANLAKLDSACWLGCEEEDELAEAIAAYEASH